MITTSVWIFDAYYPVQIQYVYAYSACNVVCELFKFGFYVLLR